MVSSHRDVAIQPVPSIDSQRGSISTPVTPDYRFRSRPLRNNSAKVSLQGHAPPAPPNHAYAHPCCHGDSTNCQNARPATPPPKPLELTPGPSSPLGLANIRIRRPPHGSLLLQSPARAGHAARMRQIFEHASREQQPPQPTKPLLYPQLPNVSRKASPPLASMPNYCQQASPTRLPQQSLCMSTASSRAGFRHAQAVFAMSEQSSESWSDDSGYLLTRSHISKLAPAFVPDDRITEWLTSVSTPDYEEHDAHVQDYDAPCRYSSSELSDNASSGLAQQPLESRPVKVTIEDVSPGQGLTYTRDSVPLKPSFPLKELITDHVSTAHPTTPIHSYYSDAIHPLLSSANEVIQLSPLSPNVCIERGPSRYHSSRNTQYSNRASPSTKIQTTPSKENTAPRNSVHAKDPAQSTPVPEAPCKVGVGTRFQHPRHAPNSGRGRWERRVEP
ncbi:uncharacterized protein yc1106_09903 [Curvularia clavata]|uniref:Uncharacterized protein n=1 Tax=Curvularia clavata TaxID=95742 RepID=A0A9Q9DY53_CURCL|nr:uncharacterized protein yc1106_09903 [Curvularia clavata]